MYVGESESRVRQVFLRARASAPCVIFFDELDALCPKRGSNGEGGGGSGVTERVVNQLLTELDGLESRKDVYIIAATNRLELIDDAMLRPGRLGKLLYVPLPNAADRISILKALTRKVALDPTLPADGGVDVAKIGSDPRTEGFSGADLAALVREAGLAVIRDMNLSNTFAGSSSSSSSAGTSSDSSAGASSSSDGGGISAVGGSVSGQLAGCSISGDTTTAASSTGGGGGSTGGGCCITERHFESALQKVRPSVALQDRKR